MQVLYLSTSLNSKVTDPASHIRPPLGGLASISDAECLKPTSCSSNSNQCFLIPPLPQLSQPRSFNYSGKILGVISLHTLIQNFHWMLFVPSPKSVHSLTTCHIFTTTAIIATLDIAVAFVLYARATTAKYHRLNGLPNRDFFSYNAGG